MGIDKEITIIPIKWAGGKYSVTSDGHVLSYVKAANISKTRPYPYQLKESLCSGYPTVTLKVDGKVIVALVHTLVCTAFNGEKPESASVVRHLDGTRTNNVPNNLAWGTYSQNESDKRRHGRIAKGEKQGIAKLTDDAVRIIRASIPYGLWNSKDAAEVFGMSTHHVESIARGEGWSHIPCDKWLFVRKHQGGEKDGEN